PAELSFHLLVFPVFFVFSSPATITVYHIARGLSSVFFKKIEKTHTLLCLYNFNIVLLCDMHMKTV
ncbi:MAG TPA: hypothetical protein DEQ76_08015, partial [Ruminococcus sp.]|nr:hypothetical protein [Ruminococcus sp.]